MLWDTRKIKNIENIYIGIKNTPKLMLYSLPNNYELHKQKLINIF